MTPIVSYLRVSTGMQEGKMTLLIVSAIFVIWLFLVLR